MGVILLQALADNAGALGISLVVLQAFAVHGGENAPVHGLQPVTGIGQSAPHDYRHGIGEIRAAHLLFDVHGEIVCAAVWRRATFEWELGVLIVCHRVFLSSPEGGKKGPVKAGPGPRAVLLFYALEACFSKADGMK
jgi:hypothetical protein